MVFRLALAATGVTAFGIVTKNGKSAMKEHCVDKKTGKAKHVSLLQRLKKSIPGAGASLDKAKKDTAAGKSYMDGFSHVRCLHEGLRSDADLHKDPHAYNYNKYGHANVSVVFYDSVIPKEDQKAMTHGVCFNFCRSLEHMNFFGLLNGRECYCTPYYVDKAGGEDSTCDAPCDGDNTQMCGGKHKTDIYEMHMCNDIAQDMQIASTALREVEGSYLYENMNLLESAKIMTHIVDLTQMYGGQAGDPVMSNQMQDAKQVIGKASKLIIGGKKYSDKVIELQNCIMEKMAVVNFTKADYVEVEKCIADQRKVVPVMKEHVAKMDKIRTYMHETTDVDTSDRPKQYMAVTGKQYLDVQKSEEYNYDELTVKYDHAKMDSVCNSKGEVMRYVVSSEPDCAWMCDRALTPKCVAYQYYPLVNLTTGGDIRWDYCHDGSDWGNSMEICESLMAPTSKNGYTVTATKDYVFADFSYHGPFSLTLNVDAGCEGIEFWDIGRDQDEGTVIDLLKWHDDHRSTNGEVQLKYNYNEDSGMWGGISNTDDFSKVNSMTFEFAEEKWYSFYTYYWTGCKVDIKLKSMDKADMGVCLLLPDVWEASYYTCPETTATDDSMPGANARCMLKVSENKGFGDGSYLNYKKGPVKNDRCMVTKRKEIPGLDLTDMQPTDYQI